MHQQYLQNQPDYQVEIITDLTIQMDKLFMTILGLNACIYIIAFFSIPYSLLGNFTSVLFGIYTICNILHFIAIYMQYKRDLRILHNQIFEVINTEVPSKCELFIGKVSIAVKLIVGLYFSSIFLKSCGIYSSEKYVCGVIEYIAVQEIVNTFIMFNIFIFNLIFMCRRVFHDSNIQRINPLQSAGNIILISDENKSTDNSTCVICQNNTVNGEQWRILPCNHGFHRYCVDTWLITHNTCPICRSTFQIIVQ